PRPRERRAGAGAWRALAQVGACDLAGLDRLAGAVEDVVRDLERDPEGEPERVQAAATEPAGGLEELPGLEGAPFEVGVDGRVRVMPLAALQRFAAGETEDGVGKQRDVVRITRARELGERTREEVVAGRASRIRT